MLLKENVNILVSKMIGLANGIIDDEITAKAIEDFKKALSAIKSNDDKQIDESIALLIEDKALYLSNCLTCQMPCGRTSDFKINDIKSEELRDLRINKLLEICNNYLNIDIKAILSDICRLGY